MTAYSEITLTGHCEEQQPKLATKQSTKLENKKMDCHENQRFSRNDKIARGKAIHKHVK